MVTCPFCKTKIGPHKTGIADLITPCKHVKSLKLGEKNKIEGIEFSADPVTEVRVIPYPVYYPVPIHPIEITPWRGPWYTLPYTTAAPSISYTTGTASSATSSSDNPFTYTAPVIG